MNYPLVIKVLGYTLWVEAGCMVLPLLFLALLPRSSGAGAVCPNQMSVLDEGIMRVTTPS